MNKKYTILCVDDEEDVLKSLQRALKQAGYNVLTALSGQEGLKVIDQTQVDLVIADQRMPVMSGSELLRIIKKKHSKICTIMLSGYSDFDSLVSAINEGEIYRFIAKPWDNEDLKTVVADALRRTEIQNVILALASSLSKESEKNKMFTYDLYEDHNTINLVIQDEGKLVSSESVFGFVNMVFESLGIDQEEKIKLLSGAIAKQEGVVVLSVDIGKGLWLRIEIPQDTKSKFTKNDPER